MVVVVVVSCSAIGQQTQIERIANPGPGLESAQLFKNLVMNLCTFHDIIVDLTLTV